jgi:tetratricopeptide (TPR) repeat protein
MGTPAYMSPEQHAGEVADARSDQFAFAVALHEALHGVRPFPGTTLVELRNSILAGRRTTARKPVPAWLTEIVERGLAIDAAARWPSMTAMLEALRRDPAVRRRRIAVGVVVIGLAGITAWALLRPTTAGDPCAGAADRVYAAWTPARRQTIASAIAASNPTTAAYVTDRLDRAAAAIGDARVDACRATRTRGEQSETLLDARMRCLDGHLAAFASVAELLSHPAPKVIDAAAGPVAHLGDLDDCASVVELSALPLAPPDAAIRASVDALHRRAEELGATTTLIEPKDALARSDALLAEARRLGYCPDVAEAMLHRGAALAETAGDKTGLVNAMALMREAAHMADSCRADRVRASALFELVQTLARTDAPAAERHDALGAAAGAVRRLDSQVLRIKLIHVESENFATDGQGQLAIGFGETAVALESLTTEGTDVASLESVAIAHLRNGTIDAGEAHAKRARELLVAQVGTDHPAVAQLNQILASFRSARGDHEGTLPLLEDALRIQRTRFGPEHRQVLITEANIGAALITARHFADARKRLEPLLPVVKRVFGDSHQLVGDILVNLVGAARESGEDETALAYGHQAVAVLTKTAGPDHPKTARARANLAAVEYDLKRYPEALADAKASLAVYERTMSPTAPSLAHVLLTIGGIEIELHDGKRALVDLDRASAIYTKIGDRRGIADADMARADAHAALGELPAGRALAQGVLDHPPDDESRDRATRWLAKHR